MLETYFYTKIFLIVLFLKSLTKSYLDYRNISYITANRNQVPASFSHKITLADHQKAADYTIEKIRSAQFFSIIDLVTLLVFTLFGGITLLSNYALSFKLTEIQSGLLFFALLGVITSIISLPRSLYFTFKIEEKYGFNKTTVKTFILDLFKGALVSIILGGIVISSILLIMKKLPTTWWLFSFIFITLFQILMLLIYPTFIAPLFNKFTPLPDGEVKETITNLLARCGFKANGLFVMDASKRSAHGNAYFTGFGKAKRIVFFDTLLNTLEVKEIEAVLAHELGHMKKKHIMKNLIKAIILSFIAFFILGYLKTNTLFMNGHGVYNITDYSALAFFMMVSGTYTYFLTPLTAFTSRKYEFEADTFASEEADAHMLISALIKMYKDNATSLTPDPIYSKFYYSHPPALERVKFLESLAVKS